MSLDLARLRALQRQAGRVEPVPVATDSPANLPEPVVSRQARAAAGDSLIEPRGEVAGNDDASVASQNPSAPPAVNAGTALFGKDGLGELRSSRPDIESLRRLIALRERKPGVATTPQATSPQLSPLGSPRSAAHTSPRASSGERHLPGEQIAPGLHLIQAHLPLPAPGQALPLAFAKRPDDALDPRRLLFFDTETTGLAGGTGTRAFMIGAADWHHDPRHGDGLRIRQLMISTLSAEPAMLRAFAQWIDADTVLSSYNGRCYDTPLLNTRYRLARIANPLSGLDHVDLLFPTRRMYRGVWENCRLATIERELLRIVREDDLPGSQAPMAWLHYLRGGSSALLQRVVAHNHQDVVTLAQLMLKLVQAHDERSIASDIDIPPAGATQAATATSQ